MVESSVADAVGRTVAEGTGAAPLRRGSPFATAARTTTRNAGGESHVLPAPPSGTRYPRHFAASVGAVLALLLAAASLVLTVAFPLGALLMAGVALVMGCWGLFGHRRGLATAGLVLACIALATSGLSSLVEGYTYVYGVPPWESYDPRGIR
jgi:hypothetical protein